jgi:hypothetical protein
MTGRKSMTAMTGKENGGNHCEMYVAADDDLRLLGARRSPMQTADHLFYSC